MSTNFSQADVEEILEKGGLLIDKDVIKWKLKKGQHHYEFRVPVLTERNYSNFKLELVGTKNTQVNRYSFVLLLNNERVRGLCPQGTHVNRYPKREKIGAPHKHKWDDQCEDNFGYIPTDITDVTNMEKTFKEFLVECSIKFGGRFEQPPIAQPELPF